MNLEEKIKALMPLGIPRYIRIFDNGGESFDRYTVIFTKKGIISKENRKHFGQRFMYIGMSENPFHPQGFGQHGELENPKGGKHLGKKIKFENLPEDCKKLVIDDYQDLWDLKEIVNN